jgi:DNA-binding CsgD family transcriptional regulator
VGVTDTQVGGCRRDGRRSLGELVFGRNPVVEALRTQAGLLPIDVHVEVAPQLRDARFPDAVEEAAYYVASEGLTNVQISERRSKSVETINSQVKSILDKTQTANRTQAIRLATNITSSFVVERSPQNG